MGHCSSDPCVAGEDTQPPAQPWRDWAAIPAPVASCPAREFAPELSSAPRGIVHVATSGAQQSRPRRRSFRGQMGRAPSLPCPMPCPSLPELVTNSEAKLTHSQEETVGSEASLGPAGGGCLTGERGRYRVDARPTPFHVFCPVAAATRG